MLWLCFECDILELQEILLCILLNEIKKICVQRLKECKKFQSIISFFHMSNVIKIKRHTENWTRSHSTFLQSFFPSASVLQAEVKVYILRHKQLHSGGWNLISLTRELLRWGVLSSTVAVLAKDRLENYMLNKQTEEILLLYLQK